jgi:hypothetical protein
MSQPVEHHGHGLKGLMRYLKSTIKQKLRYGPGSSSSTSTSTKLVRYTDSDWATCKTDRKSISGGVGILYGGPISWYSQKQRSVATSSTEAEYIAMSKCAKQSQWEAQVLRDIGYASLIGKDPYCVDIRGDNQGTLALVKNPELHDRSKHIDICYHFIRDLEAKGKVKVSYIPTTDIVADGLTKPLQRVAFEKFKSQLGLDLKGSQSKGELA